MLDIDLMILFNGFIRNYINLGLNIGSKNTDIIKQENKYFITLGKLLGFLVISKKNNEDVTEITWKDYEFNTISTSVTKINILREVDLSKDLLAIHKLINLVKEYPNRGYVKILEVPSVNRIDFLNKIVTTSLENTKAEILIIYINRDVIKNTSYFNAYLFKNNEIIKNKIGISSIDEDGNLKANFKI